VGRIKHAIRAAFVGEDVEWQASVVDRAAAIVRNTVAELPRFVA